MKLYKLNSEKLVNINLFKYELDWEDDSLGSKPERLVIEFLKPFWSHKLCVWQLPIPGSKMRCDIINIHDSIAIEVSPKSSHSFNKFFHKNELNFLKALKRDISKEAWCIKNDFAFIELMDDDFDKLSKEHLAKKFSVYL